ncbi:MAG TPA: tail fiber assembly protein, partial [Bacillota bacterium]|nr:tail fiber assembly protein [Bacillota bacterium]
EAAKQDPDNQWAAIRIVRNRLLAECDWTQIPDVPLTEEQKEAWREYRQALRDIPQTFATPDEVVWPSQGV